jgi:CBS domain containing-hemolysin-like protein
VLCIGYLSLILGELAPQTIALSHPGAIASAAAQPMCKAADLGERPTDRQLQWVARPNSNRSTSASNVETGATTGQRTYQPPLRDHSGGLQPVNCYRS